MTIADVLATKGRTVHTILPWATVAEAAQQLNRHHIGALVVKDSAHPVLGILSERDLVRELARRGPEVLDQQVESVMTKYIVTVAPGESVIRALQTMTHGRYRHLPVVDAGKLIGIVSIGDLVKSRLRDLELEAGVLRDGWIAAH
ncbi:CBS domain-containing protein [Pseudonocardia sp.]|jgi:CBS domain-containing protein|uniref:CBS domain-containing protein n=1 Tax=Pseudonocardia sp. TaxID=60912 RepID=UPI0031FD2972